MVVGNASRPLQNGLWAVSYLSDRVRISFEVPVPAPLVLLGVGLLLTVFRRSQRA